MVEMREQPDTDDGPARDDNVPGPRGVRSASSAYAARWQSALSRNVTMMIFLAKAHLGLRDDGGASSDDPIDTIRITVRRPSKVSE
jgi:hypothetical protein